MIRNFFDKESSQLFLHFLKEYIYNYKELDLAAKNSHGFSSITKTKVIKI